MSKVLAAFLDRLAERLTGLIAGLVSSRLAKLHAESQADQQSQLEDLARQYEADGKPAIAARLRQRADLLTAPELAAEGDTILSRLTVAPPAVVTAQPTSPLADIRSLPDFGQAAPKPRRKRPLESPLMSGAPPVDPSDCDPAHGEPSA